MTDTGGDTGRTLRLRALDEDDVAVLAACLQDALVPVHDMSYLAEEKRFVMVANRFCWERLAGPDAAPEDGAAGAGDAAPFAYERVHCGLSFENVRRVRTRGFSPSRIEDRGRLLEILTIQYEEGALTVLFAGGAALRLEMDEVEVLARDVGEPWPTMWRPRHPIDDDDDELEPGGGTR